MDSVLARLFMIQWSLDILSGSSCIIWQSRQIWKSCKSMVRWKLVLWSAVLQTQEPILGFRTQLAENRLLPATTKDTQTDQSEKAASSEQQPSDQVLRWQLLYVAHTFRSSKRSDKGTNTVGMAKKMKAIQSIWNFAHCRIIFPGLCIAGHPSSMRVQQHLLPAGSQCKYAVKHQGTPCMLKAGMQDARTRRNQRNHLRTRPQWK